MDRSLWAVMAGTFTLRFSTGLTGAMLGVYLAKLPEHGGPEIAATTLGLLSASFFLSELVLSPAFGILSDRIGHHRVMLFGPVFGARWWKSFRSMERSSSTASHFCGSASRVERWRSAVS